jgi:plastocyanin
MTSRPSFVLAAASLAAIGACAKKPAPPPPTANVVTVMAGDYTFQAPDTIPAGLTTLMLKNLGKEVHQVIMMRLDSGKTVADLQPLFTDPEAPIPAWLYFPLGVNGIVSGDSANATATLEPGHYVMVCFLPSPDGAPHVAKGMVRTIEVTASTAALAPEPTADLVITAKDYTWDVSAPITAGTHTIRMENAGPQLHEVQIFQLAPGKATADFTAWLQGGMKGEPPAKPVGGFAGPTPGGHGFFTTTFAPGTYVFVCFVPDKGDFKPHVMHGMVKEITVS